jgi:hypothetical protein
MSIENSYLGLDFIISSSILIVIIFSLLYIFRKKIFTFYYKDKSLDSFNNKLKTYLEANYPKIRFDYSIFQDTKKEPNPDTRRYLIIDNLVQQFINAKLDENISKKPIPKDKLWDSYVYDSKPDGNKLPKDWSRRKLLVLERDGNICQRCGTHTKPENNHLFNIKSLSDGGHFYLENLVILCNDCYKITTKKNIKYLDIKDALESL